MGAGVGHMVGGGQFRGRSSSTRVGTCFGHSSTGDGAGHNISGHFKVEEEEFSAEHLGVGQREGQGQRKNVWITDESANLMRHVSDAPRSM
jgi:hypothetical protein